MNIVWESTNKLVKIVDNIDRYTIISSLSGRNEIINEYVKDGLNESLQTAITEAQMSANIILG